MDNIDIEAATKNGIIVCNTPGASTRSVVEITIGHLIASTRNIVTADRTLRDGEWAKKRLRGTEIGGKRHKRKATKEAERLNIDNLMARLEDWALDAGDEYVADNPDVDKQDIAWDLAKGAEYDFEPDEWNILLYGGPFEGEDDLYTYIADLIA